MKFLLLVIIVTVRLKTATRGHFKTGHSTMFDSYQIS
jgi:hypothetical protein